MTDANENLNGYRALIGNAAASTTPSEIFLNRTLDHAAIIFEYLFQASSSTMEILTGKLLPDVYGQEAVRNACVAFLKHTPSPILRIAFEEQLDIESHPLLADIRKNELASRVELWRVRDALKGGYEYHFSVGDERHFRFEKSRTIPEAIIQFNEPTFGRKLHEIFTSIKQHSDRIAFN